MAYLINPVHSFRINLGLSTGQGEFKKLSPLGLQAQCLFHTRFEGHQVIEIKVENTLFHR
jgi:hypothetical protein